METKNEKRFKLEKRVSLPQIQDVDEGLLGLINANVLIELVKDEKNQLINEKIFYDNIRAYQGDNIVNEGIKKSITNIDLHSKFSVLNNGITILARKCSMIGDYCTIEDFQIVNGCQATTTIFNNQKYLTSNVWIPIKIISSLSENLRSEIIQGTNSQTSVDSNLINIVTKNLKKIEAEYETFKEDKRLYFERRPSQYRGDSNVDKIRIIDLDCLVKSYTSIFLNKPSLWGRNLSKLYDQVKDELFKDDDKIISYYTAGFCYYKILSLFNNKKIDKKYANFKWHVKYALKEIIFKGKDHPRNSTAFENACKNLNNILWNQDDLMKKIYIIINSLDEVLKNKKK